MEDEVSNNFIDSKSRDLKERYVRWNAHRINFLSFVINLILTLTGGSLIFWYTVLKDNRAASLTGLLCIAGVMLALSFIVGIVTMLNRLQDFRLTVDKIGIRRRCHEKRLSLKKEIEDSKKNKLKTQIKRLKKQILELETETSKLGNRTYDLLYVQVELFAAGNLIIFISIVVAYY